MSNFVIAALFPAGMVIGWLAGMECGRLRECTRRQRLDIALKEFELDRRDSEEGADNG